MFRRMIDKVAGTVASLPLAGVVTATDETSLDQYLDNESPDLADDATQTGSEPAVRQVLDLIVVPQSVFDLQAEHPHLLIAAVVDYVNFLIYDANFRRDEIPQEALQAFHCDYYCTQVTAGGHSRFIGNSRRMLGVTLVDVIAGVTAMGAADYARIVLQMVEWARGNPAEAQAQTGLQGGIAPELAALDRPFLDLDETDPFHWHLSHWIAGLDILQVVPDDMLPQVRAGIRTMNERVADRPVLPAIASYDYLLSDPLQLGLGFAGGAIKNPLFAVGGRTKMQVNGMPLVTYLVYNNGGKCWGVMNETGVALLDYIPGSEDIDAGGSQAGAGYIAPQVGEVFSTVTTEEIATAARICRQTNAAAAVDLLLTRLDRTVDVNFLSVRSAGPGLDGTLRATIYIVANDASEAFTMRVSEKSAQLLAEPSHELLSEATAAEIAAHAYRETRIDVA